MIIDDIKMEDEDELIETIEQRNEEIGGGGSGSNLNKKPRGSRFRGVSRNGNQWQVFN